MDKHDNGQHHEKPSTAASRTRGAFVGFAAVAAFFLPVGQRAHLLACPLMLLSGWLTSRFPRVDWLANDSSHLLERTFGWKSNPHFGPFHILSTLLITARPHSISQN